MIDKTIPFQGRVFSPSELRMLRRAFRLAVALSELTAPDAKVAIAKAILAIADDTGFIGPTELAIRAVERFRNLGR